MHSVHPLAIEAIWTEVSRHMLTEDWLQVAGTCKAAWTVQLPTINLKEDLPMAGLSPYLGHSRHLAKTLLYRQGNLKSLYPAGYLFVLRRCQTATSMAVEFQSERADEAFVRAFMLLSAHEQLQQFKHVKQLTVHMNCSSSGALWCLYEACPYSEVQCSSLAMHADICSLHMNPH